jgi:penicillin-binding protein 1A
MRPSRTLQRKPVKKNVKKTILKVTLITAAVGLVAFIILISAVVMHYSADLPQVSSLKDYKPSVVTTVYSTDGQKVCEFFKERRIVVNMDDLPDKLVQAFISAEDSRFYSHSGVDFISIIRAFSRNFVAGSIVQGGSTITQQVAKSFFLSPERTYQRKIKEAILAFRIDKSFSKDDILFLYLNQIYLGHGSYGVQAAAETYFGRPAKELTLAECALLAGLPQAPSRYSPVVNPELAKQRQIYVLKRMAIEGYITNDEAEKAMVEPLEVNSKGSSKPGLNSKAPFYSEYVRSYIEKKYGEEALYEQGLKIYTAMDLPMQLAAQEEITKGLKNIGKRQGFKGPIGTLSSDEMGAYIEKIRKDVVLRPIAIGRSLEGVVTKVDEAGKTMTVSLGDDTGVVSLAGVSLAQMADFNDPESGDPRTKAGFLPGDIVLVHVNGLKIQGLSSSSDLPDTQGADSDFSESETTAVKNQRVWSLVLDQLPSSEAALVCVEAETGAVKAMVGGKNFAESQFNRAIQAKRQPGSAFKPIIYAAALDKGYTAASVIIDSPVIYQGGDDDFAWKPKNFERKFNGPTLLHDALTRSMNIITVKVLQDIGVDAAIDYARQLGITSQLSSDLSLALGSSGVSLLELVNAFAVFDNLGTLVEPTFITRIEDRNGKVLEESQPYKKRVIDATTAYVMTRILESVIQNGTGKSVKSIGRPAAGKTGSTNSYNDAWFVGYTPQIVTGVWVGNDAKASLGGGETGSKAAAPIWLGFMQRALRGKPVEEFNVPDGVEMKIVDSKTGLLPGPGTEKTTKVWFKKGTAPTEVSAGADEGSDPAQLFKDNL